MVLRLSGGQVESLFDLGLPACVAELPADLAALDGLLAGPGVLAPIEASWAEGAVFFGRPTVPMDRFVRLMIIKARSGWGYETLVREVSDSLHLRRFCRIGLWDRVPDESTVRKLVRRLGAEVVEDICSQVIAEATSPRAGRRRFVVRAARIDSTVVEADIRYPTDLALAEDAARALAREATKARSLAGAGAPHVRDRSRQIAGRLRRLNRSIATRTGESKPLAMRLTGEAGELLAVSVREARRLAARLRARARRRGAAAKQAAAERPPPPGGLAREGGAANRPPSRRRPNGSRSCAIWPRRSARRSSCGSRASRSATGWSRSATLRAPDPPRASGARRPSSATSCSSASCARTPAAAPAA